MDLNFDFETPEGTVEFKGKLSKDEVDFLLRFAILSLMARGTLPVAVVEGPTNAATVGDDIMKGKLN